jgi:hypothetical protein
LVDEWIKIRKAQQDEKNNTKKSINNLLKESEIARTDKHNLLLLIVGSPPTSLRLWSGKASVSRRFCMGNPTKKSSLILRILLRAILRRKGIAI